MEKWFVGIGGLLLSLVIAVNDMPLAFSLVTLVCGAVFLWRDVFYKVSIRLIVWGVIFSSISALTFDYLYYVGIIPVAVYTSQRILVVRGFVCFGFLCAVIYCIHGESNGKLNNDSNVNH